MDLEAVVSDAQAGKKLELRLWLRLLSTTRLMSQEIRRRLRQEYGATLPQFDLLAQLYREEKGLRLGELSSRAMVTNGSITALVERMEKDGLIRRSQLEGDKRVTVAALTAVGRRAFEAMAKSHEAWLIKMMKDVDPVIVSGLLTHVGSLKDAVRRHISPVE